MSLEFAPASCF